MRSWVLAAVAALMLALPAVASAEVKPLDPEAGVPTAEAAGEAILADPAQLTSGSLPEYGFYEDDGDVVSPIGLGESALAGFPTSGSTFAARSSRSFRTRSRRSTRSTASITS